MFHILTIDKNIKSFSLVANKPVGAEAVIAVKLAVADDIEFDFLTYCFLRYESGVVMVVVVIV